MRVRVSFYINTHLQIGPEFLPYIRQKMDEAITPEKVFGEDEEDDALLKDLVSIGPVVLGEPERN